MTAIWWFMMSADLVMLVAGIALLIQGIRRITKKCDHENVI